MKILTTIFCYALMAGVLIIMGFVAWMFGEMAGGYGWESVRVGALALVGAAIWFGLDRFSRRRKAVPRP